jgi:hypothetical protein
LWRRKTISLDHLWREKTREKCSVCDKTTSWKTSRSVFDDLWLDDVIGHVSIRLAMWQYKSWLWLDVMAAGPLLIWGRVQDVGIGIVAVGRQF